VPIYEYKCKNCGEKFDVFVLSQNDTAILCEKCGSENTERMFSSFAAGAGNSPSTHSCGGSGRFS
jgi:putative FmdB family regulatory protein